VKRWAILRHPFGMKNPQRKTSLFPGFRDTTHLSVSAQKKNRPQADAGQPFKGLNLVRVLLAVAVLGACYLAYVSLSNGPAAGCGEGSGCSKVLQSRWAYWLGIPVSLPAVLVYLGLLGVTLFQQKRPSPRDQQRAWMAIIALSVVVAGAAAWFIGLQVFVIKAFCKFCMTAHTCGLAAAILCLWNVPLGKPPQKAAWSDRLPKFSVPRTSIAGLVVLGLAGLGTLVAGQLLVEKQRNVVKTLAMLSVTNPPVVVPSVPTNPPPVTNQPAPPRPLFQSNRPTPVIARPSNLPVVANAATSASPSPVPWANPPPAGPVTPPMFPPATNQAGRAIVERKGPRLVSLFDGAFQFNLDEVPVLGSPDAPYLMVSLFDYTCHHCRQLHPFLVEAQRRLGNQLAIISLPMPLSTNCNPVIRHFMRPHSNACDYARLGLAVWRTKREAAPQFDDWLFAPEKPVPVEQARQYAAQLVGTDQLGRALADEWITRQIHLDGYLFQTNQLKLGNGAMPQVIIGPVVSFGPLNSTQDLLRLLDQHLGLKAPW
jgi:uncharacterized membrane protein